MDSPTADVGTSIPLARPVATRLWWVVLLVLSGPVVADWDARPPSPAADPPLELRLGLISYADPGSRREWAGRVIDDLDRSTSRSLRAWVAVGTYSEVVHWIDRGVIDVAVLSPGAYAEIREDEKATGLSRIVYLASESLEPAVTPWAAESRRAPGRHYHYGLHAVVHGSSKMRAATDLTENPGS